MVGLTAKMATTERQMMRGLTHVCFSEYVFHRLNHDLTLLRFDRRPDFSGRCILEALARD